MKSVLCFALVLALALAHQDAIEDDSSYGDLKCNGADVQFKAITIDFQDKNGKSISADRTVQVPGNIKVSSAVKELS